MSKTRFTLGCALFVCAMAAFGQRKAPSINAETPHGAVMQQIAQESDAAKKGALLEEFVAKFGGDAKLKDELLWIYPQKQELHVKAQQWDQAIDAGTKTIALDDSLLEVAVATLKAAEAKKDMPLVKAWSTKTSTIARKSLATAKLLGEEDDAARIRLDYAKQVNIYADYALFNAALQGGNPAVAIEMAETLKAQSPDGDYFKQVAPQYIVALNSQNPAKAVAAAEEILAKDASSDDILLLVSNHYYGQKPEKANQDKVLLYTGKAIAGWETRQKPEGIADADWDKKKSASLGFSLWMNGMTLAQQNKLAEADPPLRRALPMLTNDQMKAPAAFYLGLGNFKAGEPAGAGKPANKAKLTDAYRFFQQCAAIKGPLQGQAASNLKVISVKYGIK
jgi:hypothetical protein